jgi:hypothetical protein
MKLTGGKIDGIVCLIENKVQDLTLEYMTKNIQEYFKMPNAYADRFYYSVNHDESKMNKF